MPTRLRTVLFDLDGTLLDHFDAIHRGHAHVRRHYGLPEPTRAEIMAAIGGGLPEALRKTLGPSHAHLVDEAIPVYREYWDRTMLDDAALLPGALEILRALHAAGLRCAVFTNKHGPSARRVCTHLGLDPWVAAVVGATDTPWLKPEVEFTAYILEKLGATATTTALVGDSPWDHEAARRAGLAAGLLVTTGTHDADELVAHGAARADIAPRLLDFLPRLLAE